MFPQIKTSKRNTAVLCHFRIKLIGFHSSLKDNTITFEDRMESHHFLTVHLKYVNHFLRDFTNFTTKLKSFEGFLLATLYQNRCVSITKEKYAQQYKVSHLFSVWGKGEGKHEIYSYILIKVHMTVLVTKGLRF